MSSPGLTKAAEAFGFPLANQEYQLRQGLWRVRQRPPSTGASNCARTWDAGFFGPKTSAPTSAIVGPIDALIGLGAARCTRGSTHLRPPSEGLSGGRTPTSSAKHLQVASCSSGRGDVGRASSAAAAARRHRRRPGYAKAVLAEAAKHLGFHEQGNNGTPLSHYFHRPKAWCADFVSYCFEKAGHPAGPEGRRLPELILNVDYQPALLRRPAPALRVYFTLPSAAPLVALDVS